MIMAQAMKPYRYDGDWTWMSENSVRRTICYRDIRGNCYKETHWDGTEQVEQVDPHFYKIFIRDFPSQVEPAVKKYEESFIGALDSL